MGGGSRLDAVVNFRQNYTFLLNINLCGQCGPAKERCLATLFLGKTAHRVANKPGKDCL